MTTSIQEYSVTEAALSLLAEHYKGVLYDVTTPRGMADAKQGRAELRGYRVALEKTRVEIKAPALKRTQEIDSEARRITAALLVLEEPIDSQIKSEENKKENERLAKEKAETDRIEAEQRALRVAEEARMATERAEIARRQAEIAAAEKASREKIEAEERAARQRREDEERKARLEREQADRAARQTREEADRKAREQLERGQAAMSEIQGIQHQVIIAQTGRLGVRAGGTIACIEETLVETEAWEIDAERFGLLAGAAAKAKESAVAKIRELLAATLARQAEEAKLMEERDRLEAERLAEETKRREILRREDELIDGKGMLEAFVHRFGKREEFYQIVKAIQDYLAADKQ